MNGPSAGALNAENPKDYEMQTNSSNYLDTKEMFCYVAWDLYFTFPMVPT
jgi:hypothetical protein